MIWDSKEIAKLNYGEVLGEWESEGLSIDSRKIEKGQLFVAFKGNNVDGHQFIRDALDKGAPAFIAEYIPPELKRSNLNGWVVKDIVTAIKLLAKHNRARSKAKFIGVTGSVGKTSVKEALATSFSEFGKVFASRGNYNNQLGLPISLASMPAETEYGIFEMGMSNLGEIDYLTQFIKPDIAIITSIAPVHIENLGSLENIAKAKSEIFNSMSNKGIAIINGDTNYTQILRKAALERNIHKILSFGEENHNDMQLKFFKQGEESSEVRAKLHEKEFEFILKARGKHQAINMLAVLLAVNSAGLDINLAIKRIENFTAVSGRGKLENVNFKGKEILILDESYNSSPMSLKAALNVLGGLPKGSKWQKKIAILGDMLELGINSRHEHEKVLEYINENKIEKIITVGEQMKNLSNTLPHDKNYAHFDDVNQLLEKLEDLLESKDMVLVKGSYGTKLFQVVNLLKGS